jgi:predicted amidophosphoribosyltransferase
MELARGISEVTRLPVCKQIVRRTRFVKSQTQMGRQERMENVADVFEAKDLNAIRGRHILLVDDVVTTGATMTACAREILKTEGVRVSLLALGFAKS